MKTGANMLNDIRDAKRLTETLAQSHPAEAPWPSVLSLLEAYEAKVADHWPLLENEKEGCKLGWFSVRNIEEAFPELHAVLSEVAHNIRHSGEL